MTKRVKSSAITPEFKQTLEQEVLNEFVVKKSLFPGSVTSVPREKIDKHMHDIPRKTNFMSQSQTNFLNKRPDTSKQDL